MSGRNTTKEYIDQLKAVRDEYRAQNKEFVKILEFYAKGNDSGVLARAALAAWNERIQMNADIGKNYMKS